MALRYVGRSMFDGDLELELRVCACGSTISVLLADG
jgi:hypothetical protein